MDDLDFGEYVAVPNGELPAYANPGSELGPGSAGLTKREHFAGLAMQGMLANSANNSVLLYGVNGDNAMGFQAQREIVHASIHYADELLKQLSSGSQLKEGKEESGGI